jgi:hypothetical protein
MGNLLTQDFNDIWFSPRAGYFKNKEYAPAECAGCGNFTACQAACHLYWRYAVGDVTSVGTAKAGVFAGGAARVVAAALIAQLRGGSSPGPTGSFMGPSAAMAAEKALFASSRLQRWFGRSPAGQH